MSISSRLLLVFCLRGGAIAAQTPAPAPGCSAEALRRGQFAEALKRSREQTAKASGDERAAVFSLADGARAHGQLTDVVAWKRRKRKM